MWWSAWSCFSPLLMLFSPAQQPLLIPLVVGKLPLATLVWWHRNLQATTQKLQRSCGSRWSWAKHQHQPTAREPLRSSPPTWLPLSVRAHEEEEAAEAEEAEAGSLLPRQM